MTRTSGKINPADEAITGTTPEGRTFIRFERLLTHPIEEVWPAVVDPTRMTEWLAYRVEIDPRVGGRLALWLGGPNEPGGGSAVQESTITRLEPLCVLEAHSDDWGTMLFELARESDGTRFTFIHTLPLEERRLNSIIAGWHLRMEGLQAAFGGRPLDWAALDASRDEHGIVARIAEIYWHYRNKPR